MKIAKIKLVNFKNYEQLDLTIESNVNLFYGNNGSGKTNLLDCINYISLAKSYFSLTDRQLITHDKEFLRVEALLQNDDDTKASMVIKYKSGQSKEIEFKKQKLKASSEVVGLIPLVFIAPNDISLVNDGSKDRRQFVDRILSQADGMYLQQLIQYNRILTQKNAHLKGEIRIDHLLLESYNDRLIELCKSISHYRREFMLSFYPILQSYYATISSDKELIGLEYKTQIELNHVEDSFKRLYSHEIQAKRSLIGIHKDDFEFLINGFELKKFGSQGQIKSFLYALRIAEFIFLKEKLNKKPILILDDFFEKLDQTRLAQLVSLINNGTFDQIFLSDTELERSQEIFNKNEIAFSAYHIQEGSIIG